MNVALRGRSDLAGGVHQTAAGTLPRNAGCTRESPRAPIADRPPRLPVREAALHLEAGGTSELDALFHLLASNPVRDVLELEGPREKRLVALDRHLAGRIVMADEPRPEAATIVDQLRTEGVRYVALVSGDRRSVAARIGHELGMDRAYAESLPEEKLDIVRSLRERQDLAPVIMVGDSVNDAPALALADLGIAMGAAGATVSSEAAGAVITVDRVDRVADAVQAGRRALHIARQSVLAGMGLSLAAMAVAAAGYLPRWRVHCCRKRSTSR